MPRRRVCYSWRTHGQVKLQCNLNIYKELFPLHILTGAFGAGDVGTRLVAQSYSRVGDARVDPGDGTGALARAPAVGEREGTLEGARHRRRLRPVHRQQHRVARDLVAHVVQVGQPRLAEC